MTETSQKMRSRAQIISILNKYHNDNDFSNDNLRQDIETIKEINNPAFCAKILLKEITDTKSHYSNTCAIILLEAIDKDPFEKEAIEFLKDKTIDDDRKFFIISLLKQKGINFDYDDINKYIQSPQEAAQNSVRDFLLNIKDDPEVQIDLLDFYLNIPKEEKIYLLNNLVDEFKGDELAYTFSLLSQLELDKDESQIIVSSLVSSKSRYSIEGLEYYLNNGEIDKLTKRKIQKSLEEIKTKYPNFKNTSIIKNSLVYKSYISFVDGKSNFSLIFSRKKENNKIDILLTGININFGIVSCMGFSNINPGNFEAIKQRIFNDTPAINIPPKVLKGLFSFYYQKNKRTQTILPYEIIVWKNLLNDFEPPKSDIAEYLNTVLQTTKLSEAKVKKLLLSPIFETWYYSYGQNKYIDEIIQIIEKEHITDIKKINETVSKKIDEHFLNNKDYLLELQSKLLIQAYCASLANLKVTSAATYSMCFKNPYLKLFITSQVDKSIYYYLSTRLLERDKENNMFVKNIIETNFSNDELEFIMEKLEAKWNQKKE